MTAIEVAMYGDISTIAIGGALDRDGARDLNSAIQNEIVAGRRSFVLDLSATTQLDIFGLRELYVVLKSVRRISGDMIIARPSDRVREQLEDSRLDEIFAVFETVEEALANF